jgi:hypothetical protein
MAAKRVGNSLHCQVIVGRPDATCGKNVIVGIGEVPDLIRNEKEFIGNDGNLSNINAKVTQFTREI